MIKFFRVSLAILAVLSGFFNIAFIIFIYWLSAAWGGGIPSDEKALIAFCAASLGLGMFFAISGVRNNVAAYKLIGALILISCATVQVAIIVSSGLF
jgi:hypothetical protein